MTNAEALLNDFTVKASRAQWVQATFITDDTELIAADANERVIELQTRLAEEVKRFNGLKFNEELDRKFPGVDFDFSQVIRAALPHASIDAFR